MNIFIETNFDKKDAIFYTKETIDLLVSQGHICYANEKNKKFHAFKNVVYLKINNILKIVDIIITLGGDGTIIQSTQYAVKADKPIIGINIGRVGFLCQLEKNEIDKLSVLKNGKFEYTERLLLEAEHVTPNGIKKYLALNDFVFSKGVLSRLVEIDVHCCDSYIETYRADGIIFSTPSGSTAYSMSSGGPIVSPVVDTIILTPICPYSRFQTPICFGINEGIVVQPKESNIKMIIDGVKSINISDTDYVKINGAKKRVKFVKIGDDNFYSHLWKKLRKRG